MDYYPHEEHYFVFYITYSWSISCVQDDMFDISQKSLTIYHCVKRVRIRSYSGSYFSRIRTEYGELRSISTYAIQMRENTNQNNSEYGHFLRSVCNFWHKYLENSVMFTQRLKWMSGPSLPLKTESWKVLTLLLLFIIYLQKTLTVCLILEELQKELT